MPIHIDPDATFKVPAGPVTFIVRPFSCGRESRFWKLIAEHREETDDAKVDAVRVEILKLFVVDVEGTHATLDELVRDVITREQFAALISEFREVGAMDAKKNGVSASPPASGPASSAAIASSSESAATPQATPNHSTSTATPAEATTPHVPTAAVTGL